MSLKIDQFFCHIFKYKIGDLDACPHTGPQNHSPRVSSPMREAKIRSTKRPTLDMLVQFTSFPLNFSTLALMIQISRSLPN